MNNNKRLFMMALGASALLASCKMGKDLDEQPIQVKEEQYLNVETPQDSLPDLEWWTIYNDPELEQLVKLALDSNRNLMVAMQRMEQAAIQLGIQKKEWLPKFNATGGYSASENSLLITNNRIDNANIGVNMNWELDIWGKYRRLTEASMNNYLASTYGYRSAQISLITSVTEYYFNYLGTKAQLDVALKTVELRQNSLDIIQARFEKGMVPEIDLNQAQIQLAIAEASVPSLERTLENIENALCVLTAKMPEDLSFSRSLKQEIDSINIPVGLPAELIGNRPDIQEAWSSAVAANSQIGAAQAARFPAISLTGLLGVASNDLSSFNNGAMAWSAGASLVGPLFYWGQNKRRVELEKSKTMAAVYSYEQVVYSAFAEVENSLYNIETLREELIFRNNHVNASLNAQALSERRYNEGVTSYLEYLESQRQAFEAQLSFYKTKASLLNSYINLYKALGGGWISQAEKEAAQQAEAQNQ